MELITDIIAESQLIIQLNSKKALLATGTNFSLSDANSITLLGQTFALENQYMGFSLKDVIAYLGMDIDYLIGSNILSKFNYKIDFPSKKVIISDSIISDISGVFPLQLNLEIPTFVLEVNNKHLSAIIDSFSEYSYLQDKNILDKTELGENSDFLLGIGLFKTKTYNSTFLLNKTSIVLKTGVYPSVIAKSRYFTTEKAILGKEIFEKAVIIMNCKEKSFQFKLL